LKPLRTKEALPIVEELRNIFAQFGPCRVLHTDNGREFENQHMHKLCAEWSVKLVHGLPRKSSTQGSVERANQDIENIIMTWESYYRRSDWAANLPIFQLMKNNRLVNKENSKNKYFLACTNHLKKHHMKHYLDVQSSQCQPGLPN
jgi:transposase InsO family protein